MRWGSLWMAALIGCVVGSSVGTLSGLMNLWLQEKSTVDMQQPRMVFNEPDLLDQVADVIIEIESGGNCNAVGAAGEIGPMQISGIMLRDIHRITRGELDWNLNSIEDSKSIFRLYTQHYSPTASIETIVRRWNGGPKGERKAATLLYWQKFQAEWDRRHGSAQSY